MLSAERVAHYKDELLKRQQDVADQFTQLEEMSQPVSPDPAIGRLTRQDAIQQQEMALESRRRLGLQRTQLQTALKRITDNKFGICVMCKEEIPEVRLDIVPEAPLCVSCLEKRNQSKGRR